MPCLFLVGAACSLVNDRTPDKIINPFLNFAPTWQVAAIIGCSDIDVVGSKNVDAALVNRSTRDTSRHRRLDGAVFISLKENLVPFEVS